MSTPGNADDRGATVAQSVVRDVAAEAAACAFAKEDDPRRAERELGRFAFQWVLAILQKMGALREPGEVYELDQLKRQLSIAPRYDRYFEALIRKLEEEGLVRLDGRVLETTAAVREGALDDVEEQVAAFRKRFVERNPACAGLLGFMARCLGRFDEIITGRIDVADVLFEDGSMDVFAEVFRGDVVSDYCNRLVAEAVRSATVRRRAGAPKVRMVEVGAGTGGTTAAILEALQPLAGAVEFCFTDISPSFLRYARRRFAQQYPWLDYRTLDIEKDLPRQGFDLHGFDVVVAANVLHDTRYIEFTLEQTRRLLKPGGLLVLNEFTAVKDCLFFSGALLHGYWLFEDPDQRLRDSCLLDVPRWRAALERTGFRLLAPFVLPTQSPDAECSQSVMLCEAVGEAVGAAAPHPEKSGIIGQQIEQDILLLLGEERSAAYSPRRPLMEMGLDSIELVELKSLMRGRFGVKLPPAFLFEHETQEKITQALAAAVPDEQLRGLPPREPAGDRPPAAAAAPASGESGVAIVGMACRLPGGAATPEAFWTLLQRGEHGIGPLPAERWQWPAFIDVEGAHKGIDQGGFLARIDEFDARFFRTSPGEAELMDPQQRLLLELSWEALEDAGHRPSELAGRKVGVFVGVCQSDYRDILVTTCGSAEGYVGSGTAYAMLANRLSYFYDFKGPSVTVDTACSSSLFALHDAVTALRRGECEQALVGAVNLLCSPTISISYYQAGMLSPTGKCRTFDAAANGYVRGEGGAMLLLKPLARAVEDGDSIYGLVRGTAVNHGGQAITLTAPKPDAQAEVVERAWQEAGLAADTIGCIEAHGTGTALGDPVEVSGLTEAFRRLYQAQGKSWPAQPLCGLGSVKSNLGHLEGAAGLAGLIKILLSFRHRQIPKTLHFERLNPEIDLSGSPFHVVVRNEAWPRFRDEQGRELPRRAGVSSFGFGGANAHAVIEEYQDPGAGYGMESAADGRPCLAPLSARSQEELAGRAKGLLAFLQRVDSSGVSGDGLFDRILGTLRGILTSRFGLEDPAPDLEWEELSWGATESLLFLTAVEEEHGLRLPSRSLVAYPTLESLAAHVVQSFADGAAAPRPAACSGPPWTLADLAWTLQVGREPMDERVAFLAGTRQELVAALRRFVAGDLDAPGCYRGFVRPPQDRPGEPPAGADLATLASLWVQGVDIDWEPLSAARRRVHLPTYPFARERHWVTARAGRRSSPVRRGRPASHPMLNQRGSLPEHRFDTVLQGDEPFLADHVIEGRPTLPAVAYLEMARAAAERVAGPSPAEDGTALWLGSVVWLRPLRLEASPVPMSLRLTGEEDGAGWSFEVYSTTDAAGQEPVLHMQGRVGIGAAEPPPVLGVAALRARCTRARYTGDDCYRALAAMGYEYGPGQRAIEELFVGDGEILARLRLPAFLAETRESMALHPAMADAAIQATFGFALAEGRNGDGAARPALPFELSRAEIFRSCSSTMWASIARTGRPGGGSAADSFGVDLCDEAGRLCVRFQGLILRAASSRPTGGPLAGEMLLMPLWEPTPVARREGPELAIAGPVMIVGGTAEQQATLADYHPEARPAALEPGDGIDDLRAKIAAWGEVGHVVWIVLPHPPGSLEDDSLLAGREGGALFGFRLIKALLGEGYGEKPLTWWVITTEAQAIHADEPASPAHAAVHGLIGTMAKEYPHWQVRLADLPSSGEWPWLDLLALAADPHGNAWAWRDRRWHRQQLAPYRPAAEGSSPYRPGGVYVVIGGAGGIGEAWSEAVLRRVPARLVWIGRRPQDEAIQARIDRLAALGPAPLYIAADATDRGELAAARDTIKRELGRIDGVIHAAMVLQDRSLENMTESEFLTGLAPKVDVCVRLAQVFAGEPLDFVLFFSSISSLLKWPGQCNYIAGGAFEDAFASRLASAWPCRVRVVNWGYWGVGALDSERYRTIMAKKGLASIELPGAMRVLDLLLTGPVRQLAYLEALGPNALDGAIVRRTEWAVDEEEARRAEREKRAAEAARIAMGTLVRDDRFLAKPREITTEQLAVDLRLRVAQTLGVDPSILDAPSRPFTGALLGEFGMDSLSSNSLRITLRRELGVDLPVHLILGEKVEGIVGALYERLLLQQVSQEPRQEIDEETETFVF